MITSIDEHFAAVVRSWESAPPSVPAGGEGLEQLFQAQLASRHLDFAARTLQQRKLGYYTIGSSGHESNAAVAAALRPTDPAMLHYRAGAFYCMRATQLPGHDAVRDMVLSLTASADDPISGGRHKVIGNADLAIIPQTSTIASHLPRAVGAAFAIGRARQAAVELAWPHDSVVVASLGDASVNHSTAVGALNAAGHAVHQGVPMPLLVVCEDNGIGISVRTPAGWTASMLRSRPGFEYVEADGTDPAEALRRTSELVARVRAERRPAILHLRTVRLMGHAGSDAEVAYRSPREILADYDCDPLLATASALVNSGARTPKDVLDEYEAMRGRVAEAVDSLTPTRHLSTAAEVIAPLVVDPDRTVAAIEPASNELRDKAFRGALPESSGPRTLAQAINASLTDLLAALPQALVFGEDVGVKGGVYGVTRGLRRAFGAARAFDTLLDEQSILGTALGSALAGYLPVPEIQYLAYLHNAEDQLRGEAASLRFFSNGQCHNGMLVRIAGLAYQKGFGGHFHNDNSVAVLTDIPGIVVGVPSSAAEAPRMIRTLAAHALNDGRVCVLLEPIALYHLRDIKAGDGRLAADYTAPADWAGDQARLDEGQELGGGPDALVVTFGNGVPMSVRVADSLRAQGGPDVSVFNLRWITPLPVEHLMRVAASFPHVVVVDETRHSGGVGESVVSALVEGGYQGQIQRVASVDSFVPLGPAADTVLLSEDDIARALKEVQQ
ncbi:thiamine pyrophosphate-dependent enzyme [Yimella sp. cx-51]|uniref:thiamine pyrophosphate-dependent enzyme n=1 Tax=Yimella sp. cx-51 TaxID=2770551 RepID=UPI00165EA86B|nr:thiamine pyrophosphate-dependent enzyme [Yimella sp. cx-51]MBC9955621.1 MFS transporter [Yimella sp. cx-51]